MGEWWSRNIAEPGKLPLLLCAAAFVVTFLVTRTITRMIRAGRGPFRDNVHGEVHVHHAVPGIVLLVIGALLSVGNGGRTPWAELAGVAVGTGTSLVLDEFALILHLQDVYWSQEGRLSVEMISLTAASLTFALAGSAPFNIRDVTAAEQSVRGGIAVVSVAHALLVLVCVAKGKYPTALFGIFLPAVAWVGAARLARPRSLWARRRYDDARGAKAERRAADFDRRWDPIGDRISNFIAGSPSP
jgi:hypothetical protein